MTGPGGKPRALRLVFRDDILAARQAEVAAIRARRDQEMWDDRREASPDAPDYIPHPYPGQPNELEAFRIEGPARTVLESHGWLVFPEHGDDAADVAWDPIPQEARAAMWRRWPLPK